MLVRLVGLLLASCAVSRAAEPAVGTVRVVWQGKGGEGVATEKYVGLVPWGHKPREVVTEALAGAEEGEAVVTLPPGKYGLVCGAEGFLLGLGGEVVVGAGQQAEVVCRVERAVELFGRVVATDTGRPLEGVKVSVYGAAVDEELSPLALQHARRTVQGMSDREGVFVVGGKPNSFAPLVFSAPGRALLVAEKVYFPPLPGVGDGGEFALPPGSEVRLEWRGPLPEGGDVEVGLWPLQGQGWQERERLARLWRTKVRPEGEVACEGVPEGLYEVRGSWREGTRDVPLSWGPFSVRSPLEILELPLAVVDLKGQLRGLAQLASWQCELQIWVGQSNTPLQFPVVADESGESSFRNEIVTTGLVRANVSCRSPRDEEAWWELMAESFSPGRRTVTVDWEVPSESFWGRLVTTAGKSAGDVPVWVQEKGGCVWTAQGRFVYRTYTDEEGIFRCPGAAGEKALVAVRPQAKGVLSPRWVSRGETVALEEGRSLDVRVVGADKKPVGRAWVSFFCRDFPNLWLIGESTGTGGLFQTFHAPACEGLLIVTPPGRASELVAVGGKDAVQVEVEATPAASAVISGKVFHEFAAACDGGNGELFIEYRGERFPVVTPGWRRPIPESPAIVLPRLWPGRRYRVVLVDGNCEVCARSRPFTLEAKEEPQELTLLSP